MATAALEDVQFNAEPLFLNAPVFNLNNTQRQQLEQYIMAFDTGLRPAVGQQVTATSTTLNDASVTARINLLIGRSQAGDCDLVVKGNLSGQARGWVFDVASGQFRSDRASDALVSESTLRGQASAAGQERTYTCVPPGSGTRLGIDRDGDGFRDRTERDAGTDPADPLDFPGSAPTTTTTSTITTSTSSTTTTLQGGMVLIQTRSLSLKDDAANSAKRKVSFKASTKTASPANRIAAPFVDPTANGASVTVYNSAGGTDSVTVSLPKEFWKASGSGYSYRNTAGAISRVTIRPDSISVKGGKALWTYTLDEPSQGRVAVRFRLGNGPTWCAEGPAKQPAANNDQVGKFKAESNSPAPGACP